MRRNSAAVRVLRWSIIGLGLLLPALSLVPLGSYWLWQNGYLIPWAIAACVSTSVAWAVQRWALAPVSARKPLRGEAVEPAGVAGEPGAPPEADWTPAERRAWAGVQAIAKTVDPEALGSRDAVLALGQRTVEEVARAIHPERADPLLQFTTPEALALIERVAGRLDGFVRESVPLGDRLTIAQLMALYRWKGAIDIAEQAWSVWRVLRLMNPASALANEVRERVSKELMAWGKSHVARRLATVFVEEVGRAAIDLYGGRLRIAPERVARHVTSASARDLAHEAAAAGEAEPLRLLIAGQVSAGKSSLVNGLGDEVRAAVDALPATARFTAYRLSREGLTSALVIDSPGLTTSADGFGPLIGEAERADLVLWVMAANRADREIDRAALAAIRGHFSVHPERHMPPVVVVLSHVDKLRPFTEWAPPYDLNDAGSAKAASMRAVIEAVSAEIGLPAADIVPVSLAPTVPRYNLDALWSVVMVKLPEAQRARLVRTLRDAEGQWDWQRLWGQVVTGGRVLVKTFGR